MGKVHAHNLAYKIPNACLKAGLFYFSGRAGICKKRIGCYGRRMQVAEKAVERHPELIFSWDL